MDLNSVFAEYREHTWYFVRPGGNWGDYLIYEGAEWLADSLCLNWKTIEMTSFQGLEEVPENTCIYIHGSGGYNSWCSGTPFSIFGKACRLNARVVVQGPCTLSEERSYLEQRFNSTTAARKCDRAIFFTRELVSLGIAQSLASSSLDGVEIEIDHDTAFLLKNSEKLTEMVGDHQESPIDLWVVRTDSEKRREPNAPSFAYLKLDPAEDCSSFSHWTRVHTRANRVFTNRLHSAIYAYLIGKEVVVYPGAYHKVHSVWKYSMEAQGVLWGPSEFNAPKLAAMVPSKLYQSYKVRKFLRQRFFD